MCNACGLVYAKLVRIVISAARDIRNTDNSSQMKKRAKEEDKLSPAESPRRPRPKGKVRQATEESEEEKGTEPGSDDALPSPAGPSGANKPGYRS